MENSDRQTHPVTTTVHGQESHIPPSAAAIDRTAAALCEDVQRQGASHKPTHSLKVTSDIRRDTRYVDVTVHFLEETLRYFRSSTAKDLLLRVAVDSVLHKSPWVEYASRTCLATKLSCAREELNNALKELAGDCGCEDHKHCRRHGKNFLRLVEKSGRRLRLWLQLDPAFWRVTKKLPDELFALADKDVRTLADEHQPDLKDFPTHIFDDLDEARLLVELERRLSGAADELSETPTVAPSDRPPAATKTSGTPTVPDSSVGCQDTIATSHQSAGQPFTPQSSETPTVAPSYSSKAPATQLRVVSTGFSKLQLYYPSPCNEITVDNFYHTVQNAQPGDDLLKAFLWLAGPSIRGRRSNGIPFNYTSQWRRRCNGIPDGVKTIDAGSVVPAHREKVIYGVRFVLSHVFKEMHLQRKVFTSIAGVLNDNFIMEGFGQREC